MAEENIRKIVREGYSKVARSSGSCCGALNSCGNNACDVNEEKSMRVGYSKEELTSVPEDANLGLGCGNPVALASLKTGETVLDLGSGAGVDCFLAARKVGSNGKVIGVDMTPEMVDKARENARKGNYENVEFRLGEIENLPVADNSVDVVISNCVINLSPDKKCVFKEAFRALKSNGRLMVSDIVLLKELPENMKKNVHARIGCLAGAEMKNKYMEMIEEAGFEQVKIIDERCFPAKNMANNPAAQTTASSIASVKISAVKPNSPQS